MRDFVIEVKEREANQPCFLMVMPNEDIGLAPNQHIIISMPEGTGLSEAKGLAREIRDRAARIHVAKF